MSIYIRYPKEYFTNVISRSMNHVICIDPGHQKKPNLALESIAPGSNITKVKVSAGAQGTITKQQEYELNLKVSNKLKDILILKGYEVVMTRQSNDVNLSNIERAKIANDAHADICIRIHADSSNSKSQNGTSLLYPAKESPNNSKDKFEKSKKLAELILKDVLLNTNTNSKGTIPRDDLTGFNWSNVPVVLIEMGFLSNPQEDINLSKSEYQSKIAQGISNGIDEFFKNSLIQYAD
ncbi:N-acetylmuramoyl-L-alanine amidase [Clostridium sp. P21]|uniref:N-acetylmuramoyl-L-alanine amidase n=1 Tax=Clostridium muellerianum TaxID=2716538 RepID=A0A7Y0EFQ5_9CLOT|nr:N-acetylmuramoyl-L-alanine amidase [Clostridium muellerianum]NMM62578.1 N-acetylmuramoyl-L-alanine amidase [Clostridium muellerianum]